MDIFMFVILALVGSARASVFLAAQPSHQMHVMTKESLEQAFSSELAALTNEKTHILAEELWPLYAALPKNEHGNLEPSAVRYGLHRFFAHKHGWHLHGLGTAQSAWNASSPTSITKELAPSYIQSLLEERVHGHGLNLEEFAVFAATMMDVIEQEAVADIVHFYSKGDDFADADNLFHWYLVGYLVGDGEHLADSLRDLQANYVAWSDSLLWVKDLRRNFDYQQRDHRNPFAGAPVLEYHMSLVQEFVHHFRSFQNLECHSLKDQLVEMEYQGSGRVPLSGFYSGFREPAWPFRESVAYLRNLGALDESVPDHPMVIIPNYISGMSNCVHPSDFYSVCCADECDALTSYVENMVAAPTAEPSRIQEVVSGLASETVEAPRNLSIAQITRLQDIADHHGGRVPLHGRLFAQWMHHAYPRECPFPHASGSTNPLSPDQWAEKGREVEASDRELRRRKAAIRQEVPLGSAPSVLPWSTDEELVAVHKQEMVAEVRASWVDGASSLRNMALLAGVVSAALQAGRVSKSFWPVEVGGKHHSHMV